MGEPEVVEVAVASRAAVRRPALRAAVTGAERDRRLRASPLIAASRDGDKHGRSHSSFDWLTPREYFDRSGKDQILYGLES